MVEEEWAIDVLSLDPLIWYDTFSVDLLLRRAEFSSDVKFILSLPQLFIKLKQVDSIASGRCPQHYVRSICLFRNYCSNQKHELLDGMKAVYHGDKRGDK